MQSFDLRERDVGDDYREISVVGELDLAVADRLNESIAAVGEGYAGVVISLAECEFIDSTGIAVIVRAHRQFAEEGRRLVVCCPADQVERVLEITGLSEDGLVFENLDQAIGAMKASAEESKPSG